MDGGTRGKTWRGALLTVHRVPRSVPRASAQLQAHVRDRRANYKQSMAVLEHAKKVSPTLITKTSLQLGHGETDAEVLQTMKGARLGT